MPDSRSHRGLHPADAELFSEAWRTALLTAVEEFSWLLTRGYAPASSLKLVGDRHGLRERQRELVLRASCTDEQKSRRLASRLDAGPPPLHAAPQKLAVPAAGSNWFIDGFNLLITLEAALGGGLIFKSRDSAVRDLASVHGTYRSVEETETALLLIGGVLEQWRPATVTWFFDTPVSNSGRIGRNVSELAAAQGWLWQVRLSKNPDADLMALSAGITVSTDSLVLDHVPQGWFPLSEHIIRHQLPGRLN